MRQPSAFPKHPKTKLDLRPEDLLPDETVLPDDYPIYGNYLYITDGKFYVSDWHKITVAKLKELEGFKEVRRCDLRRFRQVNKE